MWSHDSVEPDDLFESNCTEEFMRGDGCKIGKMLKVRELIILSCPDDFLQLPCGDGVVIPSPPFVHQSIQPSS